MMEDSNFLHELQVAINKKTDWFNTTRLQDLVAQYRLKYTCIHNLYDMMVKKNVIIPDPYRLDKKISKIVIPPRDGFSDSDMPKVFGERFSEYEMMLDYITTYMRFTVDTLTIVNVKKLVEFNHFLDWKNLSVNSSDANTHSFALCITTIKNGAPSVIQSMITDSVSKVSSAAEEIEKILKEYSVFQKELYKTSIRANLFSHPDFNKEKAFSSAENEMAEIKRLYPKVFGKQPFYSDLITEIIDEEFGSDASKRREKVLEKLQIKDINASSNEKKKRVVNSKDMIMLAVQSIGGIAPSLAQIHQKVEENFTLLFTQKQSFFSKLIASLKKSFKIKDKPKICNIPIKDARTGREHYQKIDVSEFLLDLVKKVHILNGIATRQTEYSKIEHSSEEAILSFVNKQISQMQSLFSILNALDGYFKNNVENSLRPKVRGMQIELSSMRNSIVNANKKRGEYASFKEENEQMKKLGIEEDE